MSTSEFIFVLALIFAAAGAVYLRRRFLRPGAPLRAWYDDNLRARMKFVVTAFLYATMAIWLAIWAMAPKEEDYDFMRETRELFPPMPKIGNGAAKPAEDRGKDPTGDPTPTPPTGR